MNITPETVLAYLPKRMADSHKHTYGRVLTVAGSVSYPGAAYLAGMAALRVGAGAVTVACPEGLDLGAPDLIRLPLSSEGGAISVGALPVVAAQLSAYTTVAVGSGLSVMSGMQNTTVFDFFFGLLAHLSEIMHPVICDADALNFLATGIPKRLPAHVILTPHPKELSRLLQVSVSEIQSDRRHYAMLAAKRYRAVVVLKGHQTIVSDGEQLYINHTGNAALAKAGTGDVLTGMIAGFCAQGVPLFYAACLAVFLHGRAGELASEVVTVHGVLASELLCYVPKALQEIV